MSDITSHTHELASLIDSIVKLIIEDYCTDNKLAKKKSARVFNDFIQLWKKIRPDTLPPSYKTFIERRFKNEKSLDRKIQRCKE